MSFRSWIVWQGKDLVYNLLCRFLWPRASAAVLVVEDGRLLAIDVGEYLMLPGGGLEYRESFREAAERETVEETGYRIEVGERLFEGVNSVGGPEVIFGAELLEKEPVHDGNWEGEPVWIGLDTVDERTWRHNRDLKSILDSKQS